MGRFVGIHTVPGFNAETLETTGDRLRPQLDARLVRAYSSFAGGKVVCDWEAPNREAVARACRALRLPWDEIVEIDAICEPGDRGRVGTRDLLGSDS